MHQINKQTPSPTENNIMYIININFQVHNLPKHHAHYAQVLTGKQQDLFINKHLRMVDNKRQQQQHQQHQQQPQTQQQKRHQQQLNKKVSSFDNRKAIVVIGNSQSTNMKVVPNEKMFHVYIGRIDNDSTIEDVKKALNKLNLKVFNLLKLKNNHNYFQSFSFLIPYEQKDMIFEKSYWKTGMVVRKYKKLNHSRLDHYNQLKYYYE